MIISNITIHSANDTVLYYFNQVEFSWLFYHKSTFYGMNSLHCYVVIINY